MNIIPKLPTELKLVISSYMYKPQPTVLLEDIRMYRTSLNILIDLNISRYTIFGELYNSLEVLLNNIWLWVYVTFNNYYIIWTRLYKISSLDIAEKWVFKKYNKKSIIIKIRLIWAILTKHERETFLMSTMTCPTFGFLSVHNYI